MILLKMYGPLALIFIVWGLIDLLHSWRPLDALFERIEKLARKLAG